MSALDSNKFYANLPSRDVSISQLLEKEDWFHQVPEDWNVVITDIKGSTQAVARGLHETVNLVATGSIIAVLNIAYSRNILIPFFFGGDGATLIVPSSILDKVLNSLLEHRERTLSNFQMDLRVGYVPVSKIYEAGSKLILAKVRISEVLSIPVVLGDGLVYAEQLVKADDHETPSVERAFSVLDLNGMECRWDKIEPPEKRNEVVSLLVIAQSKQNQAGAFKKVFDKIDEIYGPQIHRKPISIEKLRLKSSWAKAKREIKTKSARYSFLDLFKTWLITLFGTIYLNFTKGGKYYLNQLVQLSDTLVIDGRINTVISGTAKQRILLEKALNQLEQDGKITFGLHVSSESIMSCYVRDRDDQHIHFVDGSEGGYTKAATVLKQKLKKINYDS